VAIEFTPLRARPLSADCQSATPVVGDALDAESDGYVDMELKR
jgi:hypothetical protein